MTPDVHALTAQLRSTELSTQREAAEKLSQLGEDAAPAAPALAAAAGSEDEILREYAVAALEELGTPPVDCQAELETLLDSPQEDTVYWAATLLGRLGRAAATRAPALVAVLGRDTSTAARERAAWALGKLAVADPSVIRALDAASRDPAPRLARQARQALDTLAPG